MRKLLQVPIGLKKKALKIADDFGEDVLIDCENRYGACDLALIEAKMLNCEKIVHYGHSEFMKVDGIPIEYIETKEVYDPVPVLEKDFQKLKNYKNIGLVATVQFLDALKVTKEFLEEKGINVKIGKGRPHAGQIIGCDISAAETIANDVDAFLYVGSGKFHPLGVALESQKPVFVLDVERNEIYDLKDLREKFLKQKYVAIALAKEAQKFGILVSVRPGQNNINLAEILSKKIKAQGKKAYILVLNEVKPEKVEGLDIDCFVNTACPRISIEDRTMYKKPILSVEELKHVLNF